MYKGGKMLFFLTIVFAFLPFGSWGGDTTYVINTIESTKDLIQRARKHSNKDSAQILLEQALVYSQSAKDLVGEAKASYYLSANYSNSGRYEEALTLLNPLVNISGNSSLDSLKPHLYSKISGLYLHKGDYRSAIKAIEKAQEFKSNYIPYQININVLTSNVWANLPKAYQPQGYEKALQYLGKAKRLALVQKDWKNYSFLLNNEADILLKMERLEQCEEKITEAIKLAKTHDIAHVLKLSLITLGELEYKQKQYSASMANIETALAIQSPSADETTTLFGNIMLAKNYIAAQKYTKAKSILQKTEQMAGEQKDKARLLSIYEIQSELYKSLDKYKKAFEYYEKYHKLQEDILGREVAYEVKHLDLMYQETEKDKAILEGKLNVQNQAQQIQRKNFQIVLLVAVLACMLLVTLIFYSRYLQRKQLYRQQISMERLRAVIQGEELERARIAKELHDGIGGMLAVIGMQFSSVVKDNLKNSVATTKIQELINRTSDEIRKTAHNLLPTALETNNLANAVMAICNEIANTSDLMIDVETQGDFSKLDITFSIAVFRIIQELFQNIIKHAQATHAVVILEINKDKLTINIEDNGNGFDVHDLSIKGMGIKNIRERVRNFGGSINIQSVKNLGTTVFVLFENLEKQTDDKSSNRR